MLVYACGQTKTAPQSRASAGQPATVAGEFAGGQAGMGGMHDEIAGHGPVGGEPGGASSSHAGEPSQPGGAGAGSAAGGPEGPTWAGCSTALFCDDFESYEELPGAPWRVISSTGVVAIDSSRHASGTKSVRFSTSGKHDHEWGQLNYTTSFPLTPNEFFGRVRVLTFGLPQASNVQWNLVAAGGETANLYLGGIADSLAASFFSVETEQCWQASKTAMPVGDWQCLEWHFDGTSNTAEVWLNGVPVNDLKVVGSGQTCSGDESNWTFPTFTWMAIGLDRFGKDQARDVWMDDFALDAVRIGCGP